MADQEILRISLRKILDGVLQLEDVLRYIEEITFD